jgi:hypothetical protein
VASKVDDRTLQEMGKRGLAPDDPFRRFLYELISLPVRSPQAYKKVPQKNKTPPFFSIRSLETYLAAR